MIGGADVVVDGLPRRGDADFILCDLRRLWPDAFVQRATEPNAVPLRDYGRDYGPDDSSPAEFLVYRNEASYASWQENGATDDNQDAMVHVIVSEKGVTIVVDRLDSPLAKDVEHLVSALKRHRTLVSSRSASGDRLMAYRQLLEQRVASRAAGALSADEERRFASELAEVIGGHLSQTERVEVEQIEARYERAPSAPQSLHVVDQDVRRRERSLARHPDATPRG